MKRSPFTILAALVGLLPAGSISAQESRPALTPGAAVREALAGNLELAALAREYEVARARPTQERFLGAPMLETQVWGWPVTAIDPARTDMYMFVAEQALPGRGKRAARALVGEREADVARLRIAVRANEIRDEVRQTYVDLAVARAMTPLFDEQALVVRDAAGAATLRYAAGHAGQHDTVRSLVELTRIDGERIEWQGRARAAEARLNTLLGRAAAAPVEALAPVPPAETADVERSALERHPAIAMARGEVAVEEAELARLRGERRPDFVVGGGYMLQPGGWGAWTAKAGISWPNAPWSRGGIDSALETQTRRVNAAKARLDVVVSAVRRDVQEALVRLEAARQRASLVSTTILPHVEHALEVTRVAYAANRGEFADVIDTQRVLLSARMEAVTTQGDIVRALFALDRAAGGESPAIGTSPIPREERP
jgi:multidrug efflux system outer membrane protein